MRAAARSDAAQTRDRAEGAYLIAVPGPLLFEASGMTRSSSGGSRPPALSRCTVQPRWRGPMANRRTACRVSRAAVGVGCRRSAASPPSVAAGVAAPRPRSDWRPGAAGVSAGELSGATGAGSADATGIGGGGGGLPYWPDGEGATAATGTSWRASAAYASTGRRRIQGRAARPEVAGGLEEARRGSPWRARASRCSIRATMPLTWAAATEVPGLRSVGARRARDQDVHPGRGDGHVGSPVGGRVEPVADIGRGDRDDARLRGRIGGCGSAPPLPAAAT